ncbi:SAF domain-containing protein [Ornithinimicrobium panacihumi]|uniref:SAF domain-containing protein n=1 Tax=Ornithinimicrobium panacihumi TaxID=2008449 RepID=UPI003F8CE40F
MSTTITHNAQTGESVPPAGDYTGGGAPTLPAPPKLRRRPIIGTLVALLLIVAGALLGVWVWSTSTDSTQVVAVRSDVPRGSQITDADLMVVRVHLDPALRAVPAGQLDAVVGQRVARDLTAGMLLTPEHVAPELVPGEGQTVVGLALTPGSMPGEPLRSGDPVRLIGTAGQGDPATLEGGLEVPAEVTAVSTTDMGQTVLSVVLDERDAAEVAKWAAANRVAVVLDSREG